MVEIDASLAPARAEVGAEAKADQNVQKKLGGPPLQPTPGAEFFLGGNEKWSELSAKARTLIGKIRIFLGGTPHP